MYEEPIIASRQPGASRECQALGRDRAAELNRLTGMFILRRTAEINNKYLPPKGTVLSPSNITLHVSSIHVDLFKIMHIFSFAACSRTL